MNNFIQYFRNIKIPFIFPLQIYCDLGTSNTRIAVDQKGIVLREPTYVGYNKKTKEYVFFGEEAKSIIGKVPDFISILRPMTNGVICDFDAETALIKSFIDTALSPYYKHRLIKPPIEAIVSISSIATEIEQKALKESLMKAGVSYVRLIEKSVAAAVGCSFNIFAHKPSFIIDIGGGVVEITIISGGGIVVQKSVKNAGEHMNKLIYNYIYLKHGIIVGETTCEKLKTELLNITDSDKAMVVRGKSLETGLPKSVKIKSSDIKEALLTSIHQIIETVKELIEIAPPEIVDEIFKEGIILSGNLANAPGLGDFFGKELQMKVITAKNPQDVVVNGLMGLGKNREYLHRLEIGMSSG